MKRKLVVTAWNGRVCTANLENDGVVELHVCNREEKEVYRLGNIYVGKVKKIISNIHAAFIEVGKGVECYYDMHERNAKPIRVGDEFLVQISKEALKTKQPSVTRNMILQGKYCFLTTDGAGNGVSNKIEKEKRERLLQAIAPLSSEKCCFIVRTNAANGGEEELLREARRLLKEYEELMEKAPSRKCFSCLKESEPPYISILRNIYQDGLEEIIVEDEKLHEEIFSYLAKEQPEDVKKLVLYKDDLLPLHKLYSIEKAISDATKERVWMKSGAYLVIQPTEALTVIDVNTGKCIGKKRDDTVYMKINLEAAKEAAKQIRLRNLSGIILIDFINLESKEKIEELMQILRSEFRKDPIMTTVVDITKLQLVEITRKKIRKPLMEQLRE